MLFAGKARIHSAPNPGYDRRRTRLYARRPPLSLRRSAWRAPGTAVIDPGRPRQGLVLRARPCSMAWLPHTNAPCDSRPPCRGSVARRRRVCRAGRGEVEMCAAVHHPLTVPSQHTGAIGASAAAGERRRSAGARQRLSVGRIDSVCRHDVGGHVELAVDWPRRARTPRTFYRPVCHRSRGIAAMFGSCHACGDAARRWKPYEARAHCRSATAAALICEARLGGLSRTPAAKLKGQVLLFLAMANEEPPDRTTLLWPDADAQSWPSSPAPTSSSTRARIDGRPIAILPA